MLRPFQKAEWDCPERLQESGPTRAMTITHDRTQSVMHRAPVDSTHRRSARTDTRQLPWRREVFRLVESQTTGHQWFLALVRSSPCFALQTKREAPSDHAHPAPCVRFHLQ